MAETKKGGLTGPPFLSCLVDLPPLCFVENWSVIERQWTGQERRTAMLHHIAIDLAASSLFGAAQLRAGASASGQAVDSPRLTKPLKRTSDPMPRLAAASLDFVLRLFLCWGMAYILHKIRAQDHIDGRHHP
jgi:hypothetical protein